jgi:hypothetical protein
MESLTLFARAWILMKRMTLYKTMLNNTKAQASQTRKSGFTVGSGSGWILGVVVGIAVADPTSGSGAVIDVNGLHVVATPNGMNKQNNAGIHNQYIAWADNQGRASRWITRMSVMITLPLNDNRTMLDNREASLKSNTLLIVCLLVEDAFEFFFFFRR